MSTFDPTSFVSDKVLSAGEIITLNKALDRTKVQLFFEKNSGFLSSLIATIEFEWDRSIPTACTNGVFMAWNPEFFLSLNQKSRVTVLAHEGWHIAFQHMLRVGGRDFQDYNAAADHVINNMLEDHGFNMSGFPYLMDPAYKKMSTEEVYNDLHRKRQAGANMPNNPQGGDFSVPGSGPASITKSMTPSQIQNKAQGNIMDAATIAKMNNQAGSIPGEIQQMINKFLNPKLPWQEILLMFFESLSDQEYSYKAINRRYDDPILPGKTNSHGLDHLIYYLDISGSITDKDIVRFNSEVKYIKDTYNPEKLTLVTFDTKIREEYVFEADDEFDNIQITGRGGTNLKEVYQHIEKNEPTAVVIFTDMFVTIPSKAPSVPLIWICTNNPNATVPYGTLVYLNDED